MRRRDALAGIVALSATGYGAAQELRLAGRMGERALVVADGRSIVLAVGQAQHGVQLLRWDGDAAVVEHAGERYSLRIGAAPARAGAAAAPAAGREIVIPVASGGHFVAEGSINGQRTRFMVDTGATRVAISREEAERLRLDLSGAQAGLTQTAGGVVLVRALTLARVRVGEVEVYNVPAVVTPAPMPYVLLGNSFLDRFTMKREGDVMRLERR